MNINQQASPASINDQTMRRFTKTAHRMHVPSWLFDYSLTLLTEIPLLTPPMEVTPGYTVRPASIHDLSALANCRQRTTRH